MSRIISEDFAGTSVSPTHDDAGNLTKDADYAYVYDGWNNLVKVRAQNDADVVIGVYAYYADNRRASKVVTNRGELDGTTYFFYDGLREIEERNGAEAVIQQYVWGHEYVDQLLMIRGAGGTWFVHQDANWNVIALTTPGGDVAEEVQYQPYGLPQVRRHLAFGDSDADGDVDGTDNTAHTAALTTYNRTFDADFDADVSNTSGDADKLAWDASYNDPDASVTMVVANRSFSPTGNPFLFTGRRLDAETGLYFYRFRTYHPTLKTFIQRDPLGYVDSASLYQYVGGRPLFWLDPFGLEASIILIERTSGNNGSSGWSSGSSSGKGGTNPYGHIALKVTYDDGSVVYYDVSTPIDQSNTAKGAVNTYTSAQFVERYDGGWVEADVPGDPDEEKMRDYIESLEGEWDYNLFTNNCVTFACNVVAAGGQPLGETYVFPRELMKYYWAANGHRGRIVPAPTKRGRTADERLRRGLPIEDEVDEEEDDNDPCE
ncbi:MAG: hypothetical protein FLDDKLPJ_01767 [Phycisphaerae bacterium]|nr:hypothetical protein [Phycisphaerae bacterium]